MGVVRLDGVASADPSLVRWLAETSTVDRNPGRGGQHYRQALGEGLLHRGGGLTRSGRLLVAGYEAAQDEIRRQRRLVYRLRRHQRGLERRAYHDPLTGLPNRLLAADRLALGLMRAQRGGGGLALFYLDIDDFKTVNDRHGHGCGDRLLRTVAGRLTRCARRSDTVARFGGDEFVLIVEGVSAVAGVVAVAAKLRRSLAEPVTCGNHELQLRASIGIAVYEPGADADSLLEQADRTMYWVKARGGGCAIATPAGTDEPVTRLD